MTKYNSGFKIPHLVRFRRNSLPAGNRSLQPLRRLVLCALLLFAGKAQSQTESPVAIESRVSKATITIGDTVRYSIQLRREPNIQTRWPGPAANLGMFEIRRYQTPEAREEGGKIIEEAAYTISTFDTGRFVIPPLTVQYLMLPDTLWRELRTETLDIQVASMRPSEAGDIRDIKAPWELPRDWRQVIMIAAIAAGVLLLAGLGYYFWRKRQGKGLLPQRLEPPRPAHEIAFAELAELRNSDLLARGEIKLFYILLSEIIRRYIEGRYQVEALEMTTFELLEHFKQSELEGEAFGLLREILEQSDLVKFAKFNPPAEQHERLLDAAEALVEMTKPAPLAAETATAAAPAGRLEPLPAEAS